jgi:hypothetical protein
MFRQLLYTQWKWSRLVLLLVVVKGFSLPIVSVQGVHPNDLGRFEIDSLLGGMQAWGLLYPILATGLALLLALTTWGPDHRGRHVYALSLPIPRWHYALLRFGAGCTLLAIPVFAVWLGSLVATSVVHLPAGLEAYPTALALRFGLAAFVAYAAFFAISSGTNRTAGIILGTIGGVLLVQLILVVAEVDVNLISPVVLRLFVWPGPLEIFTGRWMLVDA